ncbi:MAG: DNA polymerase III subunit delta [Cyclobacteriaceae bacterium]|nr:DNA polymerase III subunit delta [Cyclobacteriaceae bacterium]
MRFTDIPGLQSTKEKLYRTIESGKIAHAQMFAGPEGSANLAMAMAYAALLNCTNRTADDACGTCPSCSKINKLIHPDVHYVFPVSATKNVTGKEVVSDAFIAPWREFAMQQPFGGPVEWSAVYGGENKQLNISREESRGMIRKLSLKAFEGEYKVMIIWLPEYMHPSAANAILKLLEEPPEKTVFLLVTCDQEQIIGTILSRVQLLKIRPFSKEEIAGYLTAKHQLESSKASQISSITSGNLNEAIRLINEVEDDTDKSFQEWMRLCFSNNYPQLVNWAEQFFASTKINQKGLFQYGIAVLRDTLLMQNDGAALVNAHDPTFVARFSKTLNLEKVEALYQIFNTAFYHLERNGNPKIIFLDTSLQISSAFRK